MHGCPVGICSYLRVSSSAPCCYHLLPWLPCRTDALPASIPRTVDGLCSYRDVGYNCYHYGVMFLNSVRYRGRTDHTIQSIERELLTPPCLAALDYLQK